MALSTSTQPETFLQRCGSTQLGIHCAELALGDALSQHPSGNVSAQQEIFPRGGHLANLNQGLHCGDLPIGPKGPGGPAGPTMLMLPASVKVFDRSGSPGKE